MKNFKNPDISYENILQEGEEPPVLSEYIDKNFRSACEGEAGRHVKEIIVVANRGVIADKITRAALAAGKKVIILQDPRDLPWRDIFVDKNVEIFEFERCLSLLKVDGEISGSIQAIQALKDLLEERGLDLSKVAVHPGYGLWSERVDHLEAVEKLGLSVVGPHSSSVELLGNKINALELAKEAGLTVPRSSGKIHTVDGALKFFTGYRGEITSFLLKDAAGGGGYGQLLIESHDIERFIEAVETFLQNHPNFSVDEYLPKTMHVEFQVCVDEDGSVCFGKSRNCTVQRDHQKYLEETAEIPEKTLIEIQKGIGKLFRKLKEKTGRSYMGLATVEMLYDPKKKTFYFLEVNTRIQVEYPVSAHYDGINYPLTMLDIADGKRLRSKKAIDGQKISNVGYVIEARICAEEPVPEATRKVLARIGKVGINFMPAGGEIEKWKPPSGEGVFVYLDPRIDEGVLVRGTFDSMLAQVVVIAKSRAEGIQKLEEAVKAFKIAGVETNIELILHTLCHEEFLAGGDALAGRTAAPDAIARVIAAKLGKANGN